MLVPTPTDKTGRHIGRWNRRHRLCSLYLRQARTSPEDGTPKLRPNCRVQDLEAFAYTIILLGWLGLGGYKARSCGYQARLEALRRCCKDKPEATRFAVDAMQFLTREQSLSRAEHGDLITSQVQNARKLAPSELFPGQDLSRAYIDMGRMLSLLQPWAKQAWRIL